MPQDRFAILSGKLDRVNQLFRDLEALERLAATSEWGEVKALIEDAKSALIIRVSNATDANDIIKTAGEIKGINFLLSRIAEHAEAKERLQQEKDNLIKQIEELEQGAK